MNTTIVVEGTISSWNIEKNGKIKKSKKTIHVTLRYYCFGFFMVVHPLYVCIGDLHQNHYLVTRVIDEVEDGTENRKK